MSLDRCWRLFVLHTGIFQLIRPFSTSACMCMFEMLSKMIRTEKLFRLVALSVFVTKIQMLSALFPIWRIFELLAAISTGVGCGWSWGSRVKGRARISQNRTGPGKLADVQRILVPLGLILVFESIRAKLTAVLLFRFMSASRIISLYYVGEVAVGMSRQELTEALHRCRIS